MSQSLITLGIGGTSEITWLVLTGLHADALIVGDPDNFAHVLIRNKRAYITARDKHAPVLIREKRAIVER